MARVTDRSPLAITGRPRTFSAKDAAAIIVGDIVAFILRIDQLRTMDLFMDQIRSSDLFIDQIEDFTLER